MSTTFTSITYIIENHYSQSNTSRPNTKKKKPLFVIGHMAPEQNFYTQYIMKYMVT